MSDFPILKTGAILQYPAQKAIRFSTAVLRFVDGAEQRFRDYQMPLRRWTIQLDLLDENELHVLNEFFRAQSGAATGWDGGPGVARRARPRPRPVALLARAAPACVNMIR